MKFHDYSNNLYKYFDNLAVEYGVILPVSGIKFGGKNPLKYLQVVIFCVYVHCNAHKYVRNGPKSFTLLEFYAVYREFFGFWVVPFLKPWDKRSVFEKNLVIASSCVKSIICPSFYIEEQRMYYQSHCGCYHKE